MSNLVNVDDIHLVRDAVKIAYDVLDFCNNYLDLNITGLPGEWYLDLIEFGRWLEGES